MHSTLRSHSLRRGRSRSTELSSLLPPTPVLLQILSDAQPTDDLLPEGSVFPLPINLTIEISIPGGVAGGGHSFHLHGHAFDVVRSVGSSVYDYVNTVRRDVVNIGTTGDNVTIRFTTDNPRPWFFHCHVDWHLKS
ncbi:Cupredoxin [Armillaria luteobubalina]|uniref:Cupredoxin n=1 Tax=Armillaria luteobubalina TaxID=153913 RepID=A0AA39P013_9AGAR|nr:Cupredoxin [Armillaria luteobubalina]KAK0499243.1 Cupredoxin [Armillaria luteobubalina]